MTQLDRGLKWYSVLVFVLSFIIAGLSALTPQLRSMMAKHLFGIEAEREKDQ